MSEFPCVLAVIEAREVLDMPWPVGDVPEFVTLNGRLSAPEVGAVMSCLVRWNGLGHESWPEVAEAVVSAESLILPGGLQASDGVRTISPGCCCGLETWRDWLAFLHGGAGPWMGHSPDIIVTWAASVARVWAESPDGGQGITIEFERDRLAAELSRVERDLFSFLGRVGEWAAGIGWPDPAGLCAKLDRAFAFTAAAVAG